MVLLCMAAGTGPLMHAGWASQEITLEPGWNAVYLSVQPAPKSCDEVFQDIPVKSVWTWNRRFSPVQFVRDPNTLVPEEEEWLTWFPADSYQAFLSTFHALTGGKGYLIELDSESPVTLTLSGTAVTAGTDWLSDSFNLVGFEVDPNNTPTFARFFAPAKELAGQQAYRLDREGRWERIEDWEDERIQPGEAYLVYCDGPSTYRGPVAVHTEMPGGLRFGLEVTQQKLFLENTTDTAKTLRLSLAPTERALSEGGGPSAGEVALYYKRTLAWRPMEDPLSVTLEPDSKGVIELAVRRAEMPTPSSEDAVFANTLEISDGAGSLLRVPVSARKAIDDAGLYVGLAVLDAVSEAGALDSVTPKPTPSEFRFRLIVHKDDQDPPQVHLLQHVTVMQVQPSEVPDPDDPDNTIVVPGRYVLLADDALVAGYEGVSLRDNEIVGRRISSPVFGFDDPVDLVQDADNPALYTGVIVMTYDDPKNPFLHRYHPDHNNLNELYAPFENASGDDVSENVESYTFTRTVKLTFTADDPERLGEISWGYDLIGGIYEETISGLHKRDIHLKGTFRLNRVSSVARLNDEL